MNIFYRTMLITWYLSTLFLPTHTTCSLPEKITTAAQHATAQTLYLFSKPLFKKFLYANPNIGEQYAHKLTLDEYNAIAEMRIMQDADVKNDCKKPIIILQAAFHCVSSRQYHSEKSIKKSIAYLTACTQPDIAHHLKQKLSAQEKDALFRQTFMILTKPSSRARYHPTIFACMKSLLEHHTPSKQTLSLISLTQKDTKKHPCDIMAIEPVYLEYLISSGYNNEQVLLKDGNHFLDNEKFLVVPLSFCAEQHALLAPDKEKKATWQAIHKLLKTHEERAVHHKKTLFWNNYNPEECLNPIIKKLYTSWCEEYKALTPEASAKKANLSMSIQSVEKILLPIQHKIGRTYQFFSTRKTPSDTVIVCQNRINTRLSFC